MARRKKNRGNRQQYTNRKNQKNIRNFNNFKQSTSKKSKLILSGLFNEVLNRVSDMGDPVADKLIKLTKNPTTKIIRTNWVHPTKKNYIVSYALPEKVKSDDDAWNKKNRAIINLKKFLNKILKGTSNKSEINKFINKYKNVLNNITREMERSKKDKTLSNTDILNNIMDLTERGKIDWKMNDNGYFDKYYCDIKITENKYLKIELYYMRESGLNSSISIYLMDIMYDSSTFLKKFNDQDAIKLIVDSIWKLWHPLHHAPINIT